MSRGFSENNFILQYLVTPVESAVCKTGLQEQNQLLFEKMLRKETSVISPEVIPENFMSLHSWEPYFSFGNIFVDRSNFYSTPHKVSFCAATGIESDRERKITLVLWTYMSVNLYVNRKRVLSQNPPCYKPIKKQAVTVTLDKGLNTIFVVAHTMGIRDTHSLFGLQIASSLEGLSVQLPEHESSSALSLSAEFLEGLSLQGRMLNFPFPAPEKTRLYFLKPTPEYVKDFVPPYTDISGKISFEIDSGYPMVRIETLGMHRTIEISAEIKPKVLDIEDADERYKYILQKIADVKVLNRGDHGFAIFNILARKALHIEEPADRERLFSDIALINKRVDCSDFILSGLLRYMLLYGIDAGLQNAVKDALLHYRYWMDMDGQDGMCFWSENHSLMFYTCGYLAGKMFPDAFFAQANMTGRELQALSSRRIDAWLDDVLENGFEEFLSAVYMCVTFAALINVFDFTDDTKRKKAKQLLDTMSETLARQVFAHSVIAPMGRVYRDCLYPFRGEVNSILLLATNKLCHDAAEGWACFFAQSKYTFPQNLQELEKQDCSVTYSTGNALITTEKTAHYMLTSVASPRTDAFKRWNNVIMDNSGSLSSHAYTKSLNECFHGTSYFQSGGLGYQQQLWYAALSSDAVLFMNHPGTTSEQSDMRPGYWHGNGVFPALKQEKNVLYGIYALPDSHPVRFVHAYLPAGRFQEVVRDEQWIFLRKDDGYLAFWCSEKGCAHNDMLFNAEIRYYAEKIAFVVIAESAKSDGSFQNFMRKKKALNVSFMFPVLAINQKEILCYTHYDDASQVID